MDRPFVSMLTDYGTRDGFVAVCHGVVLTTVPDAVIVDVSHDVAPGDIASGAAILAQTVPYLPRGVHLAVVDPGVGTSRRPIAVETPGGVLVGPDNGLLPWAADALGGARHAVELTNGRWHRSPVSHTFHGRDVFAPVAAALAAGVPFADLGRHVDSTGLVRLPDPEWSDEGGVLTAPVTGVDRFGNVQLAAPGRALTGAPDRLTVDGTPAARGTTFASVRVGDLVVLVDSADRTAIALNGGSAADLLRLRVGDVVRIEPDGRHPAA